MHGVHRGSCNALAIVSASAELSASLCRGIFYAVCLFVCCSLLGVVSFLVFGSCRFRCSLVRCGFSRLVLFRFARFGFVSSLVFVSFVLPVRFVFVSCRRVFAVASSFCLSVLSSCRVVVLCFVVFLLHGSLVVQGCLGLNRAARASLTSG